MLIIQSVLRGSCAQLHKSVAAFSGRSTVYRLQSVSAPTAGDLTEVRPFSEIPRETFFGLIRKLLPGGRYHNLDFAKMAVTMKADFGDIYLMPGMFGNPPMLVTHNPCDFEYVFRNDGRWPERYATQMINYHRKKHRADFFQGVEGVILTQGKVWADFRTAVNPVLMQKRNVRLYFQKMSEVNSQFVKCIRQKRDPQTLEAPDDFEEYINRWTLESVAVVGLDRKLGLFEENTASNSDALLLCSSLNDFFEYAVELETKPSLWRFVATPKFKKVMRALDTITDITSGFVEEALNRLDQDAKSGVVRFEQEQSVLEKLLKIDRKVAVVMVMDMLLAGVDTTTSTFASIMLCLAKNPEKQQKLREEVRRILPQKDSEFTEASIVNAPYLRACIKEAMRLYPLVIFNSRTSQSDWVLSGFQVPKNTIINMCPLTLLNNAEYFPRPNEFIPERWLRGDGAVVGACPASELKVTNPFVFLPFGFGARMCIGKRIVDLELEIGVARVIRNFEVEFNHPTENFFKTVLINLPNVPLKFKFKDIDN